MRTAIRTAILALLPLAVAAAPAHARTAKPMLLGRHWVAITGKPLAATAGARMFQRGGNAVDAACAMLAATSTMWDTLGWGGETQALIYDPNRRRSLPSTRWASPLRSDAASFSADRGMNVPPEYGPLAAVTPGTPGGLLVMLAEYGTMSLADVLAPAIEMAEGYPMEAQAADTIERHERPHASVAGIHKAVSGSLKAKRGEAPAPRRDLPSARSAGDADEAGGGRTQGA